MKEEEIRNKKAFDKYLQLATEDAKVFLKPEEFIRINCPACGGGDCRFEFSKAGFSHVECGKCGTLFVNPRPSAVNLKEFYSTAPSSKYWVEDFFRPVAEVRRSKIFRPRAEYVRGLFPDLDGRNIGDIGSGFGLFLEELRELAPENRFVAIEPSPEMAGICEGKGFEVMPDFLENIDDKHHGEFFLLTGFEILEHLADPSEFLKKAYSLLAPGGHLVMTTLNGQGFDIQILWERSKSVSPPQHLNFFNPTSVGILLENSGFTVEEISTPGKLDWDILEGAYKNDSMEIDRFWKAVADKGTEKAKSALQDWMSSHNFSSHMRIVAKKTP